MENANWIWSEKDDNPVNEWVVFTKNVNVLKGLVKAFLKVSADSRYHAYLNGTYIGEGPSKGFAKEYFYDEHEITFDLEEGVNRFVFFATHFGIHTHHHILGEPGFICEIKLCYSSGKTLTICSDDTFAVKEHKAFLDDCIKASSGRMHIEMYDADKWDDAIFRSDYDDGNWDRAKIRHPYNDSFWGKLNKRKSPPYTYGEIYSERVLEYSCVKADGVSVVFDFHNMFPDKRDMDVKRFMPPEWFYFSTVIESPCDMKIDMTFAYSRLWCVYGKFYLNGKTYLEHMDTWELDPRQEGPVTVRVSLSKGKNLLVMNCSNESMGRHIPLYFHTGGRKLKFYSPIDEKKGALCAASSFSPHDKEKIKNLAPEIFDILINGEYEKIEGFYRETTRDFTSLNHPQIPVMYKKTLKYLDSSSIDLITSKNMDYTKIESDGNDKEILLDFGKQVAGYTEFEISAPKETILDFYGLEYIDIRGKRQEVDGVCTGFRYICKEGKQKYRSVTWQGLRYLSVTIRNFREPVYIKNIRLSGGTCPLSLKSEFRCSDYRINKIWEISKNTMEICARDMLIADTCHEQSFWSGDFRNTALFYYYLYNDYSIIKHSIDVSFGSLLDNKLIQASLPSVPQGIIPTWSLLFMLTGNELLDFSGDEDFYKEKFPCFKKLMENTLDMCDEKTGLFNPPENDMIDWAGVDLRMGAYNTIANALLYKNLMEMTAKSEIYKDKTFGEKCFKKAELIKESMNKMLWDPDKKAFSDCMTIEGELSTSFSVQSNSIILMCQCADSEKTGILKKYMEKGFPEDFIKIGSPFAQFFYHEALINCGMEEKVTDDVIENWSKMTDAGATSCYETFPGWEKDIITRSYSHAWSCAPSFAAGNIILGVRPLSSGFKTALIKPVLGKISWATGSVPVPGGRVDVDARKIVDGKVKVLAIVPEWMEIKTESDDNTEFEIVKRRVER